MEKMEEIHYKNGCHGDTLNESDGLEGRDEQKVFLDGNENEEGFFGAIEIPEGDAQVYHPQLREVRNAEVSRLAKCLSISPQCQPVTEQVDDMSVRRSLRPSKSADFNTRVHLDTNDESRVLVLYTGGTIGMVRNKDGVLVPQPHAMENKIRAMCTMHDEEYTKVRFGHLQTILDVEEENGDTEHHEKELMGDVLLPLVLPHIPDLRRVIYTIYEYDPLLDSSNMTMDDWIQIAKDIKDSYELFDGFVVLHGTDTLAYTASALSFMLENLGKPVIVTGSQIPTFETRSDGRDNFVGALILAGNYNIPEVTVFFRHQLMRGNRTVKVDTGSLDAFHCPNMPPLVVAGINIDVDYKAIHRPTTIEKFRVHTTLNRNVVLLRLFPSIRSDTVAHFLNPPIEGVVLQCYGAGNMPSNRTDILDLFKQATKRGVIIISVTQCVQGGVSALYETGKALTDCGVIPGADLTPEAALTKLSYVLSKHEWDDARKRKKMETNLVGEMTVLNFKEKTRQTMLGMSGNNGPALSGIDDFDLIQAVAGALKLHTSEEREGIEKALFPAMLCAAAATGSIARMEAMKSYGADVSVCDYDRRTPLHVAASEGDVAMVKYLMQNGAGVHVRDRNNDTPLMCAIEFGHNKVIEALVECGAHIQMSSIELGEKLCSLARQGNLKKLESYHEAGANLNAMNMAKQTPLHAAIESGQKQVVQFLLQKKVDVHKKDIYGRTPREIGMLLHKSEITNMLSHSSN